MSCHATNHLPPDFGELPNAAFFNTHIPPQRNSSLCFARERKSKLNLIRRYSCLQLQVAQAE